MLIEQQWGAHFVVWGGGTTTQMANRRPKRGRQTASDRFAACAVDFLMSTTRLVELLIVLYRTRCPIRWWYAEEPHDKGERAVGLWSRPQREQGGDRGAEAQTFPGLTGLVWGGREASWLKEVRKVERVEKVTSG